MRYRKLDANGDRVFGNDQADFWINVPEAVAQAVSTRLSLQLGDWFLDTTDGTDWKGKILGNNTSLTRDAEIRTRTMLTTGVTSLSDYNSSVDPNTRRWSAAFTLDTVYGEFGRLVTQFVVPARVPMQIMPFVPQSITAEQVDATSEDISWTPGG